MLSLLEQARAAVAEAARQKALSYANDRRQGKAPGWTGEGMSPIVHHPDYDARFPADHRFPMSKYARLIEVLRARGVAGARDAV